MSKSLIHSGVENKCEPTLMSMPPRPGDGTAPRTVIGLRSRGCVLFRHGGGCVHCGLRAHPIWDSQVSDEAIISHFDECLASCDFQPDSTLCLYTAGSFLDDSELSPKAREAVLKRVAANPNIRRVNVESRPEFITGERLSVIRQILGTRSVEVGLGLESADDYVRNCIILKGTNLSRYRDSVAILHEHDIEALFYVLVKPPFMTESQALTDSVETVRMAFKMGADAASLEPIAVQAQAPLARLFLSGEYRPLWLWTVVEIVKRTHLLGEVLVGGEIIVPPPIAVAHNCPDCTDRVREALHTFDRTRDISALGGLSCSCRAEWERECESGEATRFRA